MKTLGIDFGTKRIGLAVSDDEGSFAFPLQTIENRHTAIEEISQIAKDRNVELIVLGDPGQDPGVLQTRTKILEFKDMLEKVGWRVEFQSEMMTSLYTDQFLNKKPIADKRGGEKKQKQDESAAAMILQRWLDKNKVQND
jgi:putative Holliday junction resolvase